MSRTPARRGHINWRPFAPDAPFPPPPPSSSSPPLCARFYNFLAGHKAARARSPNGEDSSPPSRVIYPRAASRMRRKCEKALLPLPPPPPSSLKFARRNRKPSPEILPFPAVLSRSWIEKREGGHTRAPRYLCPIRTEIRIGKKDKGGVCALNGFLGVTIFVPAFPFL